MNTETEPAPGPHDERQSSVGPAVLAGVGLLAVVALVLFWPTDERVVESQPAATHQRSAAGLNVQTAPGGERRAAGIGHRPIDAASRPQRPDSLSPLIATPPGATEMAPAPELIPEEPPAGATTAEQIAFYERRLEQAIRMREARKKFADRLPRVQARIEASPNPRAGMETFERRKKIVEDNYAKASAAVEELEHKLKELRRP